MKPTRIKTIVQTNSAGLFRVVNENLISEFLQEYPNENFEMTISLLPQQPIAKYIRAYHAVIIEPVKLFMRQHGQISDFKQIDFILTTRNPDCWEDVDMPNGTVKKRLRDKFTEFTHVDWQNHIAFCQVFCAQEFGLTFNY